MSDNQYIGVPYSGHAGGLFWLRERTPKLSSVSNLQPRDYYESPQLFGDITARLRTDLTTIEGISDSEIAAVKLQNVIAYSVNNVLKVDGRSKTKTAHNAGMNTKHLYRLLNGETWIKLNDITGLSLALGINILSVAEYQGKEPAAAHNSFGHPTALKQPRKPRTS